MPPEPKPRWASREIDQPSILGKKSESKTPGAPERVKSDDIAVFQAPAAPRIAVEPRRSSFVPGLRLTAPARLFATLSKVLTLPLFDISIVLSESLGEGMTAVVATHEVEVGRIGGSGCGLEGGQTR